MPPSSTRLATLVLAISWLPCALAADTGSDLADVEHRLQATFERKLEAEAERTLQVALDRKVEAKMDELRVREQYRLAGLSWRGNTSPAAPAPEGAPADSRATSSGASGSGSTRTTEEPLSDTLCTFSPPSTFVCVHRAESGSPTPTQP